MYLFIQILLILYSRMSSLILFGLIDTVLIRVLVFLKINIDIGYGVLYCQPFHFKNPVTIYASWYQIKLACLSPSSRD